MDKIYCLMGKSGSGKDSVYQRLIKEIDLVPIVYYTTRPLREGEKNGTEYFYVDDEFIASDYVKSKTIEKRVYPTANGDWTYATIDDGQFEKDGNGIIVAAPEQYKQIKKYFSGKKEVIPLYIYIDDGIRLQRLVSREMMQVNPNYSEICRRFDSDKIDFAELDKDKNIRVLNYSLSECVEEIKKKINEEGEK